MAATIKIKNSSTASAVPTSSDLVQGELAVNVTDKRIFTENASGTVVELGTNPTILTLPDGSASAPTLTNDGDTNTGIFFPAADTVAVTTGGTERARFDPSGNLGLGVTPSAWDTLRAFDIGSGGGVWGTAAQVGVGSNVYYGTGNFRYKATNVAAALQVDGNIFKFLTAASGTAGNAITFTQAMTLDASGNLALGSTTSLSSSSNRVDLTVNGTSSAIVSWGTGGTRRGYVLHDGTDFTITSETANNIRFLNNGTERARIDSSGNLLVGTTSTINVAKSVISFSSSNNGLYLQDSTGVSGAQFMRFDSTSSTCGSITRVTTTSAVTYNTTSDYRLKTLIGPVQGSGERIDALNPVEYSWTESGTQMRGFFAHEFKDVYNHSVNGEKDQVDDNGNPVYQSMQAGSAEVIADLVAEIKSLRQRVAALEA